ncbi:alkaline phosphatase [Cadophora sp. MPI-SDFR-AT-0126]|nr:alkaline phosphatase [Leotiomycetes sp. MPI-SDFR-AT-0126]
MRVSTLWPITLLVCVSQAATTGPGDWQGATARSFIYIVPDGFGTASQTLARDYVSALKNGGNIDRPVTYQLAADQMVLGSVRTQASDNLITDSAASATAFGCGVKTYNAAIAVDDNRQPVGSILEAAKLDGFKTGLVATSRITHATPASYAAHVVHRDSEAKIAEHEIGYGHPLGSVVDILLGGGRCYFKPRSQAGSCRSDEIDLLKFGKEKGYNVFTDRAGFDKLKGGESAKLPFVGLFTEGHMSYEIDRQDNLEPSLLEMTKTALTSLEKATKGTKRGYFIMIEASRIDHAGHSNDPIGHLHDTIQYNEVMSFVRTWIDAHPDTTMLSAADHETGGLTLHGYNPPIFQAANSSSEILASLFTSYTGPDPSTFLKTVIFPRYGLLNPTDAEVAKLVALKGKSAFLNEIGIILSSRAGVGWSTGGHSAADVTLYGYSSDKGGKILRQNMAGNWDNTQLPLYVEKQLKVDLGAATKALRNKGTQWVGRSVEKRFEGGDEHYH